MTNLEYIYTISCSEELRGRIIFLSENLNDDYFLEEYNENEFRSLFKWADTLEGYDFWKSVNEMIINNIYIQ